METNNTLTLSPASNHPWYAVRTFNYQERKVSRYFTEKEYTHFIPMTLLLDQGEEKNAKRILIPAIHNLVFVQRKETQKQLITDLSEFSIPTSIFRNPGTKKLCEIPTIDMVEFRMLCDPQYQTSVFMTQSEAEAMIGKEVRVVAGPFKGLTGKLVRKNKQYYFLKAVIGMGIMARVSRWYCEPINNEINN